MKIIVLLFALLLSGCESEVDYVIRKQKECKQIGGIPVVVEVTHFIPNGTLYSTLKVKCKFKES